jgi:regulation of enolase protein 1 (concanavalin A-like superfamily)
LLSLLIRSNDKEVPMNRFAALLLFALVVAVVTAAPAPRPRSETPWVTGWDRPVDPVGDCRFDRHGGKLTITVPGKGHALTHFWGGRLLAPRLVRDVEGDFSAQVRVAGDFRPTGEGTFRRAGLLLKAGDGWMTVQRVNDPSESFWFGVYPDVMDRSVESPGRLGPAGFVRIRRRGQDFKLECSPDGKKWAACACEVLVPLPRKLKVGVLAEATADGTFKAEFDQFKLTPLGDKTR